MHILFIFKVYITISIPGMESYTVCSFLYLIWSVGELNTCFCKVNVTSNISIKAHTVLLTLLTKKIQHDMTKHEYNIPADISDNLLKTCSQLSNDKH